MTYFTEVRKARVALPVLLAVSLFSRIAFAEGTRGGGETIDIHGRPELRELADTRETCEWVSGPEVRARVPYFNQVIKKLEGLDWYFALELSHEVERLTYCFAGPLKPIRTNDPDSTVWTSYYHSTHQTAIRLNDEVYIDPTIFSQMSERSKAMLLVHESMHSYLSMDESARNLKLRSMVRTISDIESGVITKRSQLELAMERNAIDFPRTVAELTPARDLLRFILGTARERGASLTAPGFSEEFFNKDLKPYIQFLAKWDRDDVLNFDPAQAVSGIFENLCQQGDLDAVESLIRNTKLAPGGLLACVNAVADLKDSKELTRIAHTPSILKAIRAFYGELSTSKQIVVQDGEIRVGPGYFRMGYLNLRGRAQVSVLEPRGLSLPSWPKADSSLRGLTTLVGVALKTGDHLWIQENVLNGDQMKNAFDTSGILTQIRALHPQDLESPAVQDLAIEAVSMRTRYFFETFELVLGAEAGRTSAAQLMDQIR